MKINEFRLVNLLVKNGENTIYDGPSEDAPEEIKEAECKEITLCNGKVNIII